MQDCVDFATSGSAGAAKAIRKTEASLAADAAGLARAFAPIFASRPTFVATVQPQHMYGALWRVRLPALLGCAVESATVFSPEEIAAIQSRCASIVLVTTPSFLEKLAASPSAASLKRNFAAVITSGSLLSAEVSARAYAALGVSPIEIFGSTEAGSVAWRQRKDGAEWNVFDGVSVSAEPESGRLAVDSPFCATRPFVMSDAVEFTSPRRFLLKGRTDRCVKILEKMVSLPAIEAALERHPYVERAHAIASDAATPRIWALAVLTRAGRDALKAGTYAALIHALNASIAPEIPAVALPRRMRFLAEMPLNPQGKLPRSATLPILRSPLQEPVVENFAFDGAELSADLTFIPDALYFQGHFPGFPVLPGVVQIWFARRMAERSFRAPPFAGRILRLKFLHVIQPAQSVRLRITRRTPTRFGFLYSGRRGDCSSGVFESAQ